MTRAILTQALRAELATAGRCFPSGPHSEPIAGDFFDVVALDDSRTMIAVGDVAGHGTGASGRMAVLRSENRALAKAGLSVAQVIRRLDLAHCGRNPEQLATLWIGIYDRNNDYLEYASAGHPPPVFAGADGRAHLLCEASAPPLGSGEVDKHVRIDEVPFRPGALLVAYTDGLIERSHLDLEHQIETLRGIVEQVYDQVHGEHALDGVVEEVLRRLPHSPIGAPDDVCILAVHRPR